MTGVLMVILGLSATVVGAVRQVQEHETSTNESALEQADFACPGECLECCQAHASGLAWMGKHTDDRFKCILVDPSRLPPGCDDAEAQTTERKHKGKRQYKVTCPFGDSLVGEAAKARRKKLPSACSQHMKCCCEKSDEPWYECLPLKVHEYKLIVKSHTKGSERSFVRQDQTYKNLAPCVDTNHTAVEYQKWEGGRKVSDLSTHGGCCLHAKKIVKRVKMGTRTTRHETPRVIPTRNNRPRAIGTRINPTHTTRRHDIWATVEYMGCGEHETLYRCSGDKGLTQSGSLYKGIPLGQCLGMKGPGMYCPLATHYENSQIQECVCQEDCDR